MKLIFVFLFIFVAASLAEYEGAIEEVGDLAALEVGEELEEFAAPDELKCRSIIDKYRCRSTCKKNGFKKSKCSIRKKDTCKCYNQKMKKLDENVEEAICWEWVCALNCLGGSYCEKGRCVCKN